MAASYASRPYPDQKVPGQTWSWDSVYRKHTLQVQGLNLYSVQAYDSFWRPGLQFDQDSSVLFSMIGLIKCSCEMSLGSGGGFTVFCASSILPTTSGHWSWAGTMPSLPLFVTLLPVPFLDTLTLQMQWVWSGSSFSVSIEAHMMLTHYTACWLWKDLSRGTTLAQETFS